MSDGNLTLPSPMAYLEHADPTTAALRGWIEDLLRCCIRLAQILNLKVWSQLCTTQNRKAIVGGVHVETRSALAFFLPSSVDLSQFRRHPWRFSIYL